MSAHLRNDGALWALKHQPVSWAKALIRTSKDAELVAQGKSLEQEISTRCPSRSVRSTRPDDGPHHLVECRPATPTSLILARAILARHRQFHRRPGAFSREP